MKITYHYSACVTIETPDVTILCDPWYTEGAYHGAWYHYPPPQTIPDKADLIYISHIHPDHYDPAFLKAKFPDTPVVIQRRDGDNHLLHKMQADGLNVIPLHGRIYGKTEIAIITETSSGYAIDSALIVKHGNQSVINLNDVIPHPDFLGKLQAICPNPTAMLVGYQAASPYPQQYFDVNDPMLLAAAKEKRKASVDRFMAVEDIMKPELSLVFAGSYILGGKLYYLNPYRGMGDDTDMMARSSKAVALHEGGIIDLDKLTVNGIRYSAHDDEHMAAYALKLSTKILDYEHHYLDRAVYDDDLIFKAFEHAMTSSAPKPVSPVCIQTVNGWFVMSARRSKNGFFDHVDNIVPRLEMYPDPRLLQGLLERVYHWNNAYVGSLYPIRIGGELDPDDETNIAQFMNYFHV